MPRKHSGYSSTKGPAPDQYEALHWGEAPRWERPVEVPRMRRRQRVVELGKLRALVLQAPDGSSVVVKPRRPYPRLVVGQADNRLYLVPPEGGRFVVPRSLDGSSIVRVDYDASKGGQGAYWYHDHEPAFPTLTVDARGVPQYAGGGYIVAPEGIVG